MGLKWFRIRFEIPSHPRTRTRPYANAGLRARVPVLGFFHGAIKRNRHGGRRSGQKTLLVSNTETGAFPIGIVRYFSRPCLVAKRSAELHGYAWHRQRRNALQHAARQRPRKMALRRQQPVVTG